MKTLFSLAFLLIAISSSAQIINPDSLAGTWICTEANYLPSDELNDPRLKSSFEVMKKGLLNSTFTFSSSGLFQIKLSKTTQDLSQMYAFLNGKKWYFFPEKRQVSIGTPAENLMWIDIKEENGSRYFYIQDIPLALKMKKTK